MAAWLPYRAGTGGREGCSSSAFPFHARGDDYRVLKYWHLIQRQVPEQYIGSEFYLLNGWESRIQAGAGLSANKTLLWFNKFTNKYCSLFCQPLSSMTDQFYKQWRSARNHEPLFIRLQCRTLVSVHASGDKQSHGFGILFYYLYRQIKVYPNK